MLTKTLDSQQNHYCQICGRAFKRLDLLQRHEKRQICSASDFPRPKRRRSSSASSESDSQPLTSGISHSYANPHPNPSSIFSEPPVSAISNSIDNMSGPSTNGQLISDQLYTGPPEPVGATHPLDFDTTDSGYGVGRWPAESWEQLFQNEIQSASMDQQLFMVDMPFNSLTPRMQESAERGQLSLASAALVVKLSIAFPVRPLSTKQPVW
jgi:hypothetical protein